MNGVVDVRILGAAIRIGDRTFFKPYPTTYPTIVRYIEKMGLCAKDGGRGFYTSDNTFISAEEALAIVQSNGQLLGCPKNRSKLSPEDTLQIRE